MLAMATVSYAQRGGGHSGGASSGGPGHGSSSTGAGSMGGPGESGRTTGGNPSSDVHHGDMGKQTPGTVLDHNSKLSSRLDSLLPKGETAKQACSGFKNLGQCVAAIHVSHNLGISFDDLKSKMTGDHAENLGKAIHDLKPDADAKAEAKKANHQAHDDLDDDNS